MTDYDDEPTEPDDEDVDLSREDLEELGGGDDEPDEPQPWAKLSSGDDD